MRAAALKERPSFPLMRQTDVQTIYHMQMPRWLFSDARYSDMSLEAKLTYTFLLNRFQLSRRNGWVNDFGEVFVIFPRKELARELRICEQRVTAAFRDLKKLNLIWEKRCGRGDANQIYLATVEPQDSPGYSSAPFVPPAEEARTAGPEVLDEPDFLMPSQEPQDQSARNRENGVTGTTGNEVPGPRKSRPSYKDLSHTYPSHMEVSLSVTTAHGQTDDETELTGIQALDKVSDLIRKSTIPALTAVLVRFEAGQCTLTSTNLDSYLSIRLPAQGDDFAFLLGRPKETARAFRQFDGELLLEQTETGDGTKRRIKLVLSCGPRSAELFPFLPEDFPEQQKWESKYMFTANAARLYSRVERVKYAAAAPNPENHWACRSNIQFSGSRVYTLDGYRLSCDADPELVVPAPFMASPDVLGHLKLFGNQDVTFRLGERYALVTDGVTTLTFRLPEGELFRLDSAIPSRFQAEFEVCPKGFLNELDYLKRALRGKNHHAVRFNNGELLAASQGERYATRIQGDGDANVTFGFNLDYMADALKQFEKEPAARMKLANPRGPLIIEATGRSDYALVMLVQIRDGSMAA